MRLFGGFFALGAGLIIFLCTIGLAIVAGIYLVSAFAIKKAMTRFNYRKKWMAWIPFLNFYGFADAVINDKNVSFGDSLVIQTFFIKFWWVLAIIVSFIPTIGGIASTGIQVVGLGTTMAYYFSRTEKRAIKEVRVKSYLSSIVNLVAFFWILFGTGSDPVDDSVVEGEIISEQVVDETPADGQ